MNFLRVRGTQDILPWVVGQYLALENAARDVFSLYGFFELRTPIIEPAHLFVRSLGSVTDIVEKQMFTIKRDDGNIVLRPEGTAGIVRAYVENSLEKSFPSGKFFYIGPMFRGERPQMGRLRQFHHIGCESISGEMPTVDVDVILLLDNMLRKIGLQDYTIKINTIGCDEDKAKIGRQLYVFFKDKISSLCEDCRQRVNKNVFRILDCKNPSCRQVAQEVVGRLAVCDSCRTHFDTVLAELDRFEVNYAVDKLLVRGLDYYTRTVFEVVHPKFSAGQDAIGAGGRYDNLVKEISGGKYDKPAVGFALGVERLLLCLDLSYEDYDFQLAEVKVQVVVIYQDMSLLQHVIDIANIIRAQGISCDYSLEPRSLKAQMRRANKLNADFVVLIGEEEVRKGVYTLKQMKSSNQVGNLSKQELIEKIRAYTA